MDSTPTPLVSVCIPSYQAEGFIGATISSVLRQSLEDFELIVLDDASTDHTVERAVAAADGDPRVRVGRNDTNLGPAANWNAVVAEARGRYVKLLCSDDVLDPACLERQVEALERHPGAAMACARRNVVDGHGRVLFADRGLQGLRPGLNRGTDAVRAMVRCATTPFGEPSVVLFRRSAMQEVGPFRSDYGTLIDCDYYARLLRHHDVVAIDDTLAAFWARRSSWSDRSHTRQAANARRLFGHLADDPAFGINRWERAMSMVRAEFNARARRWAFAVASLRAR